MASAALVEKVQSLSDLELAVLICLVANEHCIIDTAQACLDNSVRELGRIVNKVFGLRYTIVECSSQTTVDEFTHAIVSSNDNLTRSNSATGNCQDNLFDSSTATTTNPRPNNLHEPSQLANIIIALNFDLTSRQVQIQALELMRTRRICSRFSVYHVPEQFLFIIVLAGGEGPRLIKHLNNYMFISHFHCPEIRSNNLEENFSDKNSISSVVKKTSRGNEPEGIHAPIISSEELQSLKDLSNQVTLSVEVKHYQMNIISFLRLHRAVAGGISAPATKLFDKLARCLAPLNNLTYVTPSLIALAARKIYTHRIQIVKPENERSMQWGSDLEAVTALLEEIKAEEVIDEILGDSGAEVPV